MRLDRLKSKSAAFLFGSGISLASEAPGVEKITKAILHETWTRETNLTYGRRRPDSRDDDKNSQADKAQDFLRLLQTLIQDHLLVREGRLPSYEDLFSAAVQIFEDETAEITNPLLSESIASIKRASTHLHSRYSNECDGNRFATLALHSTHLIQSVVSFLLRSGLVRRKLEKISEVAKSAAHVDLFTLNHDLLVEQQLTSAGIKFADGFGKKNGGMTEFSWDWNESRARVHLYKLHGSINWHIVREGNRDIACRINADFEQCRNAAGKLIRPLTITPLFLTGTMVKERSYGHSLFGELFQKFKDVLSQHHTLICCGYGWSDKGINIRINQ